MRRPRIRFWQKVLGALLVVGVVPIALVSFVSVSSTRDQLTNLGVTNIRQRSTSTANAIDAYLSSRLGDIVLVAKLPDIVRYAGNFGDANAKAAARTALSAAAARSPEYESVAVVDPNGTITAASIQTDEGTSVKFREYFTTALAGSPFISDPSYSVITNKPALFFSAPVKDAGGKILAVVRTRVNLGAIWDIVEGDAGSVGAGTGEQRGVVTRLVSKPWGYVLAVPLTTYTKAADDATFDAMSVVVLGLLLSFVIGVALTRSLVRPLRRLVGEATQVSTGDVDLRYAHFDTRSGDDITHEVASAFDRMLNALRFYALADEAGAGGDD